MHLGVELPDKESMTTVFSLEAVRAPETIAEASPDSELTVAAKPAMAETGPLYRLAAAMEQANTGNFPLLRPPAEAWNPAADRQETQAKAGFVIRIRFREEVTTVALPWLHRVLGGLKQALLLAIAAGAVAGFVCWIAPR
jgi:hypothetical protein